MNNQRLHRANSFIRVRKERAGLPLIKDEVEKLSEHRNFQHQINFTQALSKIKQTLVLLFTRPVKTVKLIVAKLKKIFAQTVELFVVVENISVNTK